MGHMRKWTRPVGQRGLAHTVLTICSGFRSLISFAFSFDRTVLPIIITPNSLNVRSRCLLNKWPTVRFSLKWRKDIKNVFKCIYHSILIICAHLNYLYQYISFQGRGKAAVFRSCGQFLQAACRRQQETVGHAQVLRWWIQINFHQGDHSSDCFKTRWG